jgi:hypothetical protein
MVVKHFFLYEVRIDFLNIFQMNFGFKGLIKVLSFPTIKTDTSWPAIFDSNMAAWAGVFPWRLAN